jgi:hypothetical protein
MITLAQATAAPAEVTLGDSIYRMSPLHDCDYGEFENWLAAHPTRPVLGSPEAAEIMASHEGVARLVWLGLRVNHPYLALAEVAALLADDQTMRTACSWFDFLNRAPEVKADNDGPQTKTIDRTTAYRLLAEKFNWPPEVIARMTPLQQAMVLTPLGGRHTRTETVSSLAEAMGKMRKSSKPAETVAK